MTAKPHIVWEQSLCKWAGHAAPVRLILQRSLTFENPRLQNSILIDPISTIEISTNENQNCGLSCGAKTHNEVISAV